MAPRPRVDPVLLLCVLLSLNAPIHASPPHVPSTLTPAASPPTTTTTTTLTSTSPTPTNPLITAPALLHLQPRALATCGYISGNAAYPLTCPAGYNCISTVQDMVGWACCDAIQCVGNYMTCADFGAGLCGNNLDPAACSSIYTSILSCSDSTAPSCFLYARSTALGDTNTHYSYGCGANGNSVLALATTTGADGAIAGAAASSTTDYFPTAPTTPVSTDLLAGGTSSTTNPSSNSNGGSENNGNNGLNTGSLIGIIIAAVGTLATIVGAYFAWKAVQKRRDRAMATDSGHYSAVHRRPPLYNTTHQTYGAPPRPAVYGGYGNSYGAGNNMYGNNGWR